MHCHLVIPGLLPPVAETESFAGDSTVPALMRLLSRGKSPCIVEDSYQGWWCRRFGIIQQQDWPLAPLSVVADGGEAGDAYWLCADPVHLSVNRDQLILADSSAFSIDPAEAAAFTDALNAHFSTDGFAFHPLRPTRWYLRLPSPADLRCTPLADAIGRNIDKLLPIGGDASRFRVLLNEIQMLLFAHPQNEIRETAGQLPVNSVWLWGGGRLPAITQPAIASLRTRDHAIRSLALPTTIPLSDLPENATVWLAQSKEQGEHWMVLDRLQSPWQHGDTYAWQQALAGLESNWFVPILKALSSGQITQLVITGFGDGRYIEKTIARGDLWKLWQRPRPLTQALQPLERISYQ